MHPKVVQEYLGCIRKLFYLTNEIGPSTGSLWVQTGEKCVCKLLSGHYWHQQGPVYLGPFWGPLLHFKQRPHWPPRNGYLFEVGANTTNARAYHPRGFHPNIYTFSYLGILFANKPNGKPTRRRLPKSTAIRKKLWLSSTEDPNPKCLMSHECTWGFFGAKRDFQVALCVRYS